MKNILHKLVAVALLITKSSKAIKDGVVHRFVPKLIESTTK